MKIEMTSSFSDNMCLNEYRSHGLQPSKFQNIPYCNYTHMLFYAVNQTITTGQVRFANFNADFKVDVMQLDYNLFHPKFMVICALLGLKVFGFEHLFKSFQNHGKYHLHFTLFSFSLML